MVLRRLESLTGLLSIIYELKTLQLRKDRV